MRVHGSLFDVGRIGGVGGVDRHCLRGYASMQRVLLHGDDARRRGDDDEAAQGAGAAALSQMGVVGINSSGAREGRRQGDERRDRPPPISPSYSERGSSSPSSRSSSVSRSSRSEGLPPPMSPSYVGASPRSMRSSGTSGYGSSGSSRSGSPCQSPMPISCLVEDSGTTITVEEKVRGTPRSRDCDHCRGEGEGDA